MAQKNYKVNEAIKVVFQAGGASTGLSPQLDVYDEVDALDVAQSVVMTEIGVTGRYVASFTPDTEGDWHVEIDDGAGGKAVKHYSVGQFNIADVGAKAATIESKVDIIDNEFSAVDSAVVVVDNKIDALDSQLTATDAKVSILDSHLDVVEGKIDSLESPPMVG